MNIEDRNMFGPKKINEIFGYKLLKYKFYFELNY